jgi:hypothetical protein
MLQKMRVLLLVCITAVLAACGGGDGGTDVTPNFAGTYQLSTLNLTSNTCGGSPAGSIAGGVDVAVQNGRNISMSNGAATGTLDGDNGGFTLSSTQVTNGVTITTSVKFRVTASGASTFAVQLGGVGTSGNVTCTLTYAGTATKS